MPIAWRTVGSISDRASKDTTMVFDPFASLKRIGIDQIPDKRGHKYLTVTVDHDTGWLVWAALVRAYCLKEGLRTVFKLPCVDTTAALDKCVSWTRRCRVPSFVKLQKSIVKHRGNILASVGHGLSNGRIEFMNTKVRPFTQALSHFTIRAHLNPQEPK